MSGLKLDTSVSTFVLGAYIRLDAQDVAHMIQKGTVTQAVRDRQSGKLTEFTVEGKDVKVTLRCSTYGSPEQVMLEMAAQRDGAQEVL